MQAFESWDELYHVVVGNQIIACNQEKVVFFLSNGILVESRLDAIPRSGHALLEHTRVGPELPGHLADLTVAHLFLAFNTMSWREGIVRETSLRAVPTDENAPPVALLRFRTSNPEVGFLTKDQVALHLEWASAKDILQEASEDSKNEEERWRTSTGGPSLPTP